MSEPTKESARADFGGALRNWARENHAYLVVTTTDEVGDQRWLGSARDVVVQLRSPRALDIHEHNGQLALEAAGLTAEFRAIIHEGGEATRMLDSRGTVLLDEPDDGSGGRPEVLRGDQ